jgi:hypothetical protein
VLGTLETGYCKLLNSNADPKGYILVQPIRFGISAINVTMETVIHDNERVGDTVSLLSISPSELASPER